MAAIAYLKELHQLFGDWATVLAAYNCGEARVLRVIRSQKVNYLDNFWDLYQRLPRETARYVPRFLACLHIIKNLEKYGFDKLKPRTPLKYESISISKRIRLKDISRICSLSQKELQLMNPELRRGIIPGTGYELKVPKDTKTLILKKLNTIQAAKSPKTRTLSKRKTVKYVVKRGDSLWILARRYSTTTQKIMNYNKLHTTRLHIGQSLKIPQRNHKTRSKKKEILKTYHVKRGDFPFEIAKKHNMSLKRFLRVNHLTVNSKIYPGQKLYVE